MISFCSLLLPFKLFSLLSFTLTLEGLVSVFIVLDIIFFLLLAFILSLIALGFILVYIPLQILHLLKSEEIFGKVLI